MRECPLVDQKPRLAREFTPVRLRKIDWRWRQASVNAVQARSRVLALPIFNPATSLREHCGRYLIHLDDHVGRNIIASCRISNSLGTLGFIKAIGLAFVGAEESQQPPHAFLIVDEVNSFCSLLCHLESFGEIPLDHETWHGPLLCMMWSQCRCSRILSIKAVIFRRHAVVHD